MKRTWKNNSLSICFASLFIISLIAQAFTGHAEYNQELLEDGQPTIAFISYLSTGHFLQATFENWESEFFQMGLFVILTISLRQKGSSESKAMDKPEEVDREPSPFRKNTPWPVRKGGLALWIYRRSLSIAFFLLFAFSFMLHFYGSLEDENAKLLRQGLPQESFGNYITGSRFWFESFQNWQSEFLSVFAIVVLSIFLRQQGSPQSKPVDAADDETGE
ncbi:DUF6766 family protein [Foetidibacter luteolus]|uniref:DUF6766 family protein n=1 Tax=Foetidibacter luteolus TaxID=2608880 RepID=UPI00129A7F85|nr:DUF6766 family protein [Foetidibacter luteolus]